MDRKELLKSKEFWIVKIQNQLYEELEKYLNDENMSKTDFAKKMGFSKGYISQILNGDFDHKLSKLIEISLAMDKIPNLKFENINHCIKIDKEIGLDKLNINEVHVNLNYNINFHLPKIHENINENRKTFQLENEVFYPTFEKTSNYKEHLLN